MALLKPGDPTRSKPGDPVTARTTQIAPTEAAAVPKGSALLGRRPEARERESQTGSSMGTV